MIDPVPLLLACLVHLAQSGVIAAVAALLLRNINAGSAAVRARIAGGAFYAAALLPLATRMNGSLSISWGSAAEPVFAVEAWRLITIDAPWVQAAAAGVLTFVGLVMVARFVSTARAVWAGEQLAAQARSVDPTDWSLPAAAPVAVSAAVAGPMVAGLRRPRILVPPRLLDLPAAARTAVLEHELAHLRRGDLGQALVQRLVLDVYWWNPAMGWLGRTLSEQRELACDDAVSARHDPVAYALCLVREARLQSARPPAHGLGAVACGLERRIDRLAGSRDRLHALPVALAVAVLLAVGLVTPRVSDTGATYLDVASD